MECSNYPGLLITQKHRPTLPRAPVIQPFLVHPFVFQRNLEPVLFLSYEETWERVYSSSWGPPEPPQHFHLAGRASLCSAGLFSTRMQQRTSLEKHGNTALNLTFGAVQSEQKVTAHQVNSAIFHNYNQGTSLKCIQAAVFDSILPDELLHTALYNVNVSTLKANLLVPLLPHRN